jgi:hypothetical protein
MREPVKLEIHFKTPDTVDLALEEVKDDPEDPECNDEALRDELKHKIRKWIEYGESVTLIYDEHKDEMIVKRVK